MFPNMFCGACKSHHHHQRNLKMNLKSVEPKSKIRFQYPVPFDIDPNEFVINTMSSKTNKNGGGIRKMASKVSNFSDLIHRVTASCLLHPLCSGSNYTDDISEHPTGEDGSEDEGIYKTEEGNEEDEEEGYSEPAAPMVEEQGGYRTKKEIEMVLLMGDVFEAVSSMKRAYVSLQEAHCPWDADKMRLSDVAVVAELRKLGVFRERFQRSFGMNVDRTNRTVTGPTLRAVVAPYEAAMEKLKMEVKSKEAEVDNLREKLKAATTINGSAGSGGRKSRSHSHQSKRRVSCSSQFESPTAGTISPASIAVPELFETCMNSVKEGSKSFASLLLSLMKAAHWDITATVKSITGINTAVKESIVGPNHAKYSLESYVNRRIFQGFDHETFYIDGSLSSLLNSNQFRSECFTQYSDMKSLDPRELLGILPTCQFGKFCSKKYLSVVHPKMEESLFGDLEQRRQLLAGNHPRSRFYGEFLALAKAVWLLHLVAFSMDPLPSHFEGSRGAEFHPEYMESAVRFPGGRVSGGLIVGFPVSPGFKLGNGHVVKARVYLVPKSEL
ncbi:hypothetical protein L2E82_50916 [Cichorium intybus]|nr:hypothetical protein L2E82_50916 [Cichorium intybus]